LRAKQHEHDQQHAIDQLAHRRGEGAGDVNQRQELRSASNKNGPMMEPASVRAPPTTTMVSSRIEASRSTTTDR